MAIKTVLHVDVQSNLAEQAKLSKLIKDDLQAAGKTRIPGPVMAARQGVSAAAKNESREYGIARSGMGTGAEGRDFAKQAQGLGGLVHVYATFAANLFAVSAAFGALSRAADTTNMIKGLDQLGAASGQALGTLSKRLSLAADGAISLRDAMTATAQASSAGMSSDSILRMGEVAKKASQALGIAMPDALSRISRGITKLEPELLDELGILIRVDTASQNYARSIGKSASALTDFEKRQGFANAVLEQGEKKFGAIKIDANPYAKILASMENIAQVGLELVNNVLAPIVSLLSQSPVGLATAMAAIAAVLLKQAIPALGAFRENALQAAEDARILANTRSKAAAEAGVEGSKRGLTKESAARISAVKVQMAAELAIKDKLASAAEDAAEARADKTLANLKGKVGKKTTEIIESLRKASTDVGPKDIQTIQSQITRAESAGNKQRQADYQAVMDTVLESKKVHKSYADQVVSNDKKIAELEKQAAAEEAKRQTIKANYWSMEAAAQRDADKANKVAESRRIVAATGEITRTAGVLAAYRSLNKEIATSKTGKTTEEGIKVPGLGLLEAGFTRVKGIIGIATTALSVFASTLSTILFYVGIAVTAFNILDNIFSTNAKAATAFSNSLTATKEAGELANRVLDDIASKSLKDVFSIESIMAVAGALTEVSNSLTNLNRDLDEVIATSSGWDRLINNLISPVGADIESKFAKQFGYTLSKGLELIPEGPLKEEVQKKIQETLNTKDFTVKGLQAAFSKLPDDIMRTAAKSTSVTIAQAQKGVNAVAQELSALDTSLAKTSSAYDDVLKSLKSSDPLSNLGAAMLESSLLMASAFNTPKTALIELNNIIKDTSKLRLFSPEQQKDLLNSQTELGNLAVEAANYERQITIANKKLEEAKLRPVVPGASANQPRYDRYQRFGTLQLPDREGSSGAAGVLAPTTKTAVQGLETNITELKDSLKKVQDYTSEYVKKYETLSTSLFTKAYALITRPLVIAQQEASININKARVSGMTGVGTAEVTAALRQEEIGIRIETNKQTSSLNETMMQSNLLAAENNNLIALDINSRDLLKATERNLPTADLESTRKKLVEESGVISEVKKYAENAIKFMALSKPAQAMASKYEQARIGSKAERTRLGGESKVTEVEKQVGIARELQATKQRELQDTIDLKNVELERSKLAASFFDISDETSLAKRQQLEIELEQKNNYKVIDDLNFKINEAVKRIADTTNGALLDGLDKNLSDTKKQLAATIALQKAKDDSSEVRRKQEIIKNNANIAQQDFDIATQQIANSRELIDIEAELKSVKLDALISSGALSEKDAVARKAAADKEVIETKARFDTIAAFRESSSALAKVRTNKELAMAAAPGEEISITTMAKKQETDINNLLVARLAIIDANTAAKITGLNVTTTEKARVAAVNDELAKQTEIFASLESLSNSLAASFEGVGTVFSKVLGIFKSSAEEQLALEEKKRKDILKIRNDPDLDPTERAEKELKINEKYIKKTESLELDKTANIIGATKDMFAEKTVAYRAFGAVEKVLHIASVAMKIQEALVDTATTKTTILNSLESMYIKGKEAVVTALNLPPPFGFLAGAAMAAVVAGLIGSAISVNAPAGLAEETAKKEQRQAAQGTGTVLGDDSAKSESVKNSLEIIKNTSVDGLSFSNKMVDLLTSIDKGISGVAQGVYGVVGIRSGSQFGTKEGTSGFNFLGGLLGSSSKKDITDSGIKLEGTFAQFMGNVKGLTQSYEDVLTTSTKSFLWFTSTTQSFGRAIKDNLGDNITTAISDVFNNAGKLFVEAGSKLGVTAEEVMSKLSSIPVSQLVSLRGLSGDALEKELSSVLSSILDTTAKTLFGSLSKFAKFGEGMLETVMRVTDGLDKVNLAMTSLGKGIVGTGLGGIPISEALIDASGSLSDFLSKTKDFSGSFLTETERLAPVQAAVNKELNSLGYSSNLTREQFKQLVLGFNVTDEASAKTYVKLLNLSGSVDELSAASEAAASKTADLNTALLTAQGKASQVQNITRAKELAGLSALDAEIQRHIYLLQDAAAKQNQEAAIYTALGKTEDALAITRKAELDTLVDSLKPGQKYLYALQDEASMKTKLTTAYNAESAAINSTITSLKASIKTLAEYKKSLTAGSISILTPAEKYVQAKKGFLETAALAKSVITSASTAEEIAARDNAIASLSATSDTFLNSSRELFASSEQYTKDFSSVLDLLDSTSSVLTSQETEAKKQLAALDASVSALNLIVKSTDTTASLLKDYLALQAKTETARAAAAASGSSAAKSPSAYANGGLASGISLVGEVGPEIVDFKTPGRVYSNAASNDLFNTKELVAEIRNLRKEVAQLRSDQREQTGHLIASNYDANNKNAITVANANEDALNQQNWKARSQVKIA